VFELTNTDGGHEQSVATCGHIYNRVSRRPRHYLAPRLMSHKSMTVAACTRRYCSPWQTAGRSRCIPAASRRSRISSRCGQARRFSEAYSGTWTPATFAKSTSESRSALFGQHTVPSSAFTLALAKNAGSRSGSNTPEHSTTCATSIASARARSPLLAAQAPQKPPHQIRTSANCSEISAQRLLPSWPWAQGVAGSNPVARPFFSQILTAYRAHELPESSAEAHAG